MDDEIDIQDLAADEIRELLSMEGSELDEQQAAALKLFIRGHRRYGKCPRRHCHAGRDWKRRRN